MYSEIAETTFITFYVNSEDHILDLTYLLLILICACTYAPFQFCILHVRQEEHYKLRECP